MKRKFIKENLKTLFGVLLCTALLLQVLFEPELSLASPSPSPSTWTTNPPLSVISQKLETAANKNGVPSVILKAVAFEESSWRQFDDQGNPIIAGSPDHPAIGIMQISNYSDTDQATITKLKTDIDFNIQAGVNILNQKWQTTPAIGDNDRNKLENWYFTLWAYNDWDGVNNPNQIQIIPPVIHTTAASTAAVPSASTAVAPSAYQDRILALISNPPACLSQFIQPINISKIPPSTLPQTGTPAMQGIWQTPSPFHLGDLTIPIKYTTLVRIAGTDSIDTAIQQAAIGWPQGAPSVVLARSDDYPDALAGVPLAAQLGAPILITPPTGLDSRVQTTIKTLNPAKIYLLGGTGALSTKVSSDLDSIGWDSTKQIRLGGSDRYATAAIVAQNMTGGLQSPSVAIATGENFPDALSIASIAGQLKMPVLLTEEAQVPQETLNALQALKPSQVYLIGGKGVISQSVAQEVTLTLNLPESSVTRLSGASRYDTMAAVGNAFDSDIQSLCFATGEDFPNALTGAALASHINETLILLPRTSLDDYSDLKELISHHLPQSVIQPYLFGNVKAIPTNIEDELNSTLTH